MRFYSAQITAYILFIFGYSLLNTSQPVFAQNAIKLEVSPTPEPKPALKYNYIVTNQDKIPGNAVPLVPGVSHAIMRIK